MRFEKLLILRSNSLIVFFELTQMTDQAFGRQNLEY